MKYLVFSAHSITCVQLPIIRRDSRYDGTSRKNCLFRGQDKKNIYIDIFYLKHNIIDSICEQNTVCGGGRFTRMWQVMVIKIYIDQRLLTVINEKV